MELRKEGVGKRKKGWKKERGESVGEIGRGERERGERDKEMREREMGKRETDGSEKKGWKR